MMQLGFGFSAAQSGLMTLATALGSIAAKPLPLRCSDALDSAIRW